jgi:hypothetical protein
MKPAGEELLEFERFEVSGRPILTYSDRSLWAELQRVRGVWDEVVSQRGRAAIYRYLDAVWKLVALWRAVSRPLQNCERAIRLTELDIPLSENVFSMVIACTSDPVLVDRRTRHKWGRALQYANENKKPSELSSAYIRRKGGINRCACLGSRAA